MRYGALLAILIPIVGCKSNEALDFNRGSDDVDPFVGISSGVWLGKRILEKSDRIIITYLPNRTIEFKGDTLSEGIRLLDNCLLDEWSADESFIKGEETWIVTVECYIFARDDAATPSDEFDIIARFPVNGKICKNGRDSLKSLLTSLDAKCSLSPRANQ